MIQKSFYGELEQAFNHYHTYCMKILLGDYNARLGGGGGGKIFLN